MGVKMSGTYLGDKKVRLVHEDSGTVIQTAAPKDNQGDGSSFSPTDLFCASLVACMLSMIGIEAAKDATDLGGTHFTLEKLMSPEPPRRVAEVRIDLHMPSHLNEAHRRRFELVSKACPVSRSIHPDVQSVVTFSYDV
jgi:uncharacterized OsmC-like protein